MTSEPLFVHCCHCRWCQRETGAAFALNAMIEADRVEMLAGEVEVVATPSNSRKGQKISRCPKCRIAVWSNYSGAGDAVRFVRGGTLDEPAAAEYYEAEKYWPNESLERRAALRGRPAQR